MQPAGQLNQRLPAITPPVGNPGRAVVREIKLAPRRGRPTDDDAALLAKLFAATASGDRQAFAHVYELSSGKLFAVALRILRSRTLAEEVLQEAFLSIWERAGQRRLENSSPMAWMIAIVRHRAIDRLRTGRNEAQDMSDEDRALIAAPGLGPEEMVEADEMGDSIWSAIGMLPVNHRNAVLAAFYYGLTHEELAKKFDVPLGTAKSWVRRGLNQLKHHSDE